MSLDAIKAAIRDVPDFPVEGIVFKDITPVLGDAELLKATIKLFSDRYADMNIQKVAGVESRGFIFGTALATEIKSGFIPIRKKGKLPWKTFEKSYDLEYGSATLEMHQDAVKPGERVLLLDDLLATGGTAAATRFMLEQAGAEVVEAAFLIELAFLNGREKLAGLPVFSPIVF